MFKPGDKVAFVGATADNPNKPRKLGSLGKVLDVGRYVGTDDLGIRVEWSRSEVYWHRVKNIKLALSVDAITITDSYV